MNDSINNKATKIAPRLGFDDGEVMAAAQGAALAKALRIAFPQNTAKLVERLMIARLSPVSHATVKSWLAGQMPLHKHLAILYREFGTPFIRAVTRPCASNVYCAESNETIQNQLSAERPQLREHPDEKS